MKSSKGKACARKEIFKDTGTSEERFKEVADAINKFSNKFEIDTKLKMCHFIGQIGAETCGLLKLDESVIYYPKRVVEVFGIKKYAHLFQVDGKISNVSSSYNSGILKIKSTYHGSNAELFNVTYACRLGNRGVNSGDGMKFKGKGFVHLTGRYNYKIISDEWNKDKENESNQKMFHFSSTENGHLEELESKIEIAIKASLYYWQLNEVNEYTGTEMSDNNIRKVSGLINTGKSTTAWGDINGINDREKFTEKADKILPQ